MSHKIILVQSKPGLGKSTLARAITKALIEQGIGADFLNLGERLRAISEGHITSSFTAQLRENRDALMHHGIIDDPALIHGIVLEALDKADASITVIDGYPRYIRLIDQFMQMVDKREVILVQLVILDGSDRFAIERMHDRGRELSGVAEDAQERLEMHHRNSQVAINRLEARYGALHVDAHRPLEEKTAAVLSCINLSSLL
jgi:adenylate kinase family enzyme